MFCVTPLTDMQFSAVPLGPDMSSISIDVWQQHRNESPAPFANTCQPSIALCFLIRLYMLLLCCLHIRPYGHPDEPLAHWLVPRFGIPSHNYCIALLFAQVTRHRTITETGPFSAVSSPFILLAKEAAATATAAAAARRYRVTAAAAGGAGAAGAAKTRLLSDVPDMTMIIVGQPPRVVDQSLKKDINQVDFVGYIPNPHYSRSKAPGESRKAATPLQHKRLAMAADKGGIEAARAARIQVCVWRGPCVCFVWGGGDKSAMGVYMCMSWSTWFA